MCLAGSPNALPRLFFEQMKTRRQQRMMMATCVLDLLDGEDDTERRGRIRGSRNIKRTRKSLDDMWEELGSHGRKAYRMSRESFLALHENLRPSLEEQFDNGVHGRQGPPNGFVSTKLRLSAAIRFFAGAAVYDIMLTHGIGRSSVYTPVYLRSC